MCFMSMILHRSPDLKGVGNIKRRIKQRILDWNDKKYEMLNSSTIICAEAYMNRKRGGLNTEERAKAFSSLICRGKIREDIRYICEQESGGIMLLGDVDSKTGNLIKETLKSKYPEGRDVSVENLPEFESCPEMIDIVVTEENVEKVAKRLSSSAGLSGIDSLSMSHWLLKFGASSTILRKSFADLT